MSRLSLAALGAVFAASGVAAQETQPRPLAQREVPIAIDSGPVANTGDAPEVVFSTVVSAEGATWLRVGFDQVTLSGDETAGSNSFLLLTSVADGAWQYLNAAHVRQWQDQSAYFNGDAVLVELVAQPGTGVNRVVIDRLIASDTEAGGIDTTICFSTDDRQLSSDPRAGRSASVGCSVWMIDDCNRCFLTAGHCQSGTNVILFNVPLSSGSGGYNFPPPEDQYPVDPSSMQGNGGAGVGNDWAYFGTFANSNTGLTAYEAQGASFVLADVAPPVSGQSIRITGYGTVSSPVSPTWNGVQKTHVGPFVTSSGTTVQYQTDTTGGNSGSPVIDETTGMAIGIHTHGGCGSSGGQNSGTAIQHAQLQAALASPTGVCAADPLNFAYPDGLPEFLLDGQSVLVEVTGGAAPAPGTGQLHYDAGAGLQVVAMGDAGPGRYEATFPPLPCRNAVSYYFSVADGSGDRYYALGGCYEPADGYTATAIASIDVAVEEDFNGGDGAWTAGAPGDNAVAGLWEHGVPVGTVAQPSGDHTPGAGGECWVTGASATTPGSNDVDAGVTTVSSAVYDLSSDPNASVSYALWYANTGVVDDTLTVDINNGSGWVNLLTLGPGGPGTTGGWTRYRHRVADHVAPTATVQLRIVASDLGSGSIVEAALDDFKIDTLSCGAGADCPADLDGDGAVDLEDLLTVLANFGLAGGLADGDINGNGQIDLDDLLLLLNSFGPCA